MMSKIVLNLALCLTIGGAVHASAQEKDAMSSSKMSKKMKMDTMKGMSMEDKAALFNKMTDSDKMMASKMAGHDAGKMSSADRMTMMDKMSMTDKAAAFDKMPESKRMAMMDKMHNDKMGKMDKMDKMDKKQ